MSSKLVSRSEEETTALGSRLASSLDHPRIVLLYGELGVGKTAFTRGFAAGMGMRDLSRVHSPSFTLINQYETPLGILFHVDLYRLETARDLYSIGLDELLSEETWAIVEWADRLPWSVPDPVQVTIQVESNETRSIRIRPDSVGANL
jgi:tRNA threonylcarbamoyladenosine biosynthesis protein TsaE